LKKVDNNIDSGGAFDALLKLISLLIILIVCIFSYSFLKQPIEEYLNRPQLSKEEIAKLMKQSRSADYNPDLVENGIHVRTGMAFDKNFKLVRGACTSCHSPKLITQNRATRAGWKQMIDWMQETQGLQDLGEHESKILDYLSTHYAPEEEGRRAALDMEEIEWYVLKFSDDGR